MCVNGFWEKEKKNSKLQISATYLPYLRNKNLRELTAK